jgi:hypothetical protein
MTGGYRFSRRYWRTASGANNATIGDAPWDKTFEAPIACPFTLSNALREDA